MGSLLQKYIRGSPSRWKDLFSIAAGIVLPAFCLYMDPIVFAWSPQGQWAWGTAGQEMRMWRLAERRFFAYSFIVEEMAVLFLGLFLAFRLGPLSSLWGGLLLTGAAISALVGLILLPLSLIGLLFLMGALGFSPWIAALPYLREGLCAAEKGKSRLRRSFHVGSLLLGVVLALGVPAWIDIQVSSTIRRSLDALCHGPAAARHEGIRHLGFLKRFGGLPELIQRWSNEKDDVCRERLAESFMELTGQDIEDASAD